MFEQAENEQARCRATRHRQNLAVKGPRTVDNTLANYDDALKQLNSTLYLSSLMEAVHPDAAFRDRATSHDPQGERGAKRRSP